MPTDKKADRTAQDPEEELELRVPGEDAVAQHDKELRALQRGLSQVRAHLDIFIVKAAVLTAPDAPYPGAGALTRALNTLDICRKDLAEAQTGLAAAEEQWQSQRND